jgi:uncharacterized membrane protein required for colicin V production
MIYGAVLTVVSIISTFVGIWLAKRLTKAVTDSFDKKHPDPPLRLLCVRRLGVVLAVIVGLMCGPVITISVLGALPIVGLMILFGYPTTRAITETSLKDE